MVSHIRPDKTESIVKFCIGSYKLPIETGRWKSLDRVDHVCPECQALGYDEHYTFYCSLIRRDDLVLPVDLGALGENLGENCRCV